MSTMLLTLREAPWLGARRALAWLWILAGLSLLTAFVLVVVTQAGMAPDPWGRPLGTDFTSFWSAAELGWDGTPGAAWDPESHAAMQHASFAAAAGYAPDYYAFFYPPPFLLLCLPLGLLPYDVALWVWLIGTGMAYAAVLRALLPRAYPSLLAALAYPAFMVNAQHGQNGALSTALMGTAALQLDQRPRVAGACLGALCFKPQLALLIVPALVAARRWRALGWAAGIAAMLCLASWMVLDSAAWRGFLADAPLAKALLEEGLVGFGKMASTFAGLRLLGMPTPYAWVVQTGVSAVALLLVLDVARRRPGAAAEIAAIAAAGCLATPFLLDYDLMLLAVPMAWLAASACRHGYRPWEKLGIALGFVLPLVARPLAMHVGLPVGPVVMMILVGLVARRCRATVSPAPVDRGFSVG